MLQSIGTIFADSKARALQPADVRAAVEQWLRETLGSEQVYCVQAIAGTVTIRVGTPLLYQEVKLREYDLAQELAQRAGYTLKHIILVPSYY